MTLIVVYTKYLAPTDFKGARIRATAMGEKKKTVTVGYRHESNVRENHFHAAQGLLDMRFRARSAKVWDETQISPREHQFIIEIK